MKYLGASLIVFGILLVLGAAGLSDRGLASFDRVILQVMIGLVIIGGGVILVKIIHEIEHINKRKERRK